MVTTTCDECGATYQTHASWMKRVSRHCCSRSCSSKARGRELVAHAHKGTAARTPEGINRWRSAMTGSRNPAWKGGVTVFKAHGNYTGVRYLRCPPELLTMARKDGYVMEHRLVMARLAKRPLTRTEVVHHVDHDPTNNAPTNLELWPDNRSHKLAEHGRHVEGAANLVSLAA